MREAWSASFGEGPDYGLDIVRIHGAAELAAPAMLANMAQKLRQKPNSAPLMIMSTPMNARRVQR